MKCWGYGRNGQLGQGDVSGGKSDLSQPFQPFHLLLKMKAYDVTLQGTKISPTKALLKMIFLSPRWDMLIFMFLFFHQTWVVISKKKSSRSLGKLSNLTSIFFKGVETTNYSYYVNQEVSTNVSHLFVVLKSQSCQVGGHHGDLQFEQIQANFRSTDPETLHVSTAFVWKGEMCCFSELPPGAYISENEWLEITKKHPSEKRTSSEPNHHFWVFGR